MAHKTFSDNLLYPVILRIGWRFGCGCWGWNRCLFKAKNLHNYLICLNNKTNDIKQVISLQENYEYKNRRRTSFLAPKGILCLTEKDGQKII